MPAADLTGFDVKARTVAYLTATLGTVVPFYRLEKAGAFRDNDPRGLPVYGADGAVAGQVADLWVDRMEMMFRYIEVALPDGGRRLLPIPFARIKKDGVEVHALLARQFADVPSTRSPEQVTMLEEEKICACYGAGQLYATPDRKEPIL